MCTLSPRTYLFLAWGMSAFSNLFPNSAKIFVRTCNAHIVKIQQLVIWLILLKERFVHHSITFEYTHFQYLSFELRIKIIRFNFIWHIIILNERVKLECININSNEWFLYLIFVIKRSHIFIVKPDIVQFRITTWRKVNSPYCSFSIGRWSIVKS